MRIEGTCTIDASVERVWDLLLDPAVLARAIPGCDKFEPTGAEEFAAVLKIGVASVNGTYTGRVKI
ncbi:MAG: carbon monoxide dehydrogenase, partial [Chloroflexi bacterium]|nr:carbon monoxide dehydrogenase [Chloroflexota bacterium]